jgi:hypothetical protein
MSTFVRRVLHLLWRCLRILLVAAASAGPAAPPPPPPPPPPVTEQVDNGQLKGDML